MATLSDPIADFLTRLKNACMAGNEEFRAPHSNMKEDIAKVLKDEGYIWNFEIQNDAKGHKEILVKTKFIDGESVVKEVKRVSKPGRRQYVSVSEIPYVMSGLGSSIISTSAGVMSGAQARRKNTGGEILAFIK